MYFCLGRHFLRFVPESKCAVFVKTDTKLASIHFLLNEPVLINELVQTSRSTLLASFQCLLELTSSTAILGYPDIVCLILRKNKEDKLGAGLVARNVMSGTNLDNPETFQDGSWPGFQRSGKF